MPQSSRVRRSADLDGGHLRGIDRSGDLVKCAVSVTETRPYAAVMTFSSALVLFAHPDDAEFMCGGTIAAWTREGCEVHYVVITDGSAGNNEPGATREQMRPIREQEQRASWPRRSA